MLADSSPQTLGFGALGQGVLLPGTFMLRLVHFIADHLPQWRDHPDRPAVNSERELTTQLGNYLNGAARHSLDIVQFMTEVPDSVQRGRSIDIAIQPRGVTLNVEGRRFSQFEVLLPIECKRLPTPRDPKRSEREYVTASEAATTGGIQRFKLGAHAAAHTLALMIGYIQKGKASQWLGQINEWIAMEADVDPAWAGEQLAPVEDATSTHIKAVHHFRSNHRREKGMSENIELWHLWIAMKLQDRTKQKRDIPRPAR